MKTYICYLLCGLFAVMAAGSARADWSLWTVTQTKRVLRDDPPGTATSVKLQAARNEWESFQILLRSDVPIKAVNLEPGDLRRMPYGIIPGLPASFAVLRILGSTASISSN